MTFQIFNRLCPIPEINPPIHDVIILFIYRRVCFANGLFKILASVYRRNISQRFSFLVFVRF